MDILDQVEQLKAQAVELLLAERERIDAQLAILQPDKKDPSKRRGRPPKPASPVQSSYQLLSQSEMTQPAAS